MRRVALVTSHPIQYQAPWFRALANVCDLTVLFGHRQSAEDQGQAGFGQAFDWDVPLLDGYRYEWLTNVAASPGVDRYSGCDTPGIRERLEHGAFDACIVSGWYLKCYLQAIRAAKRLGIRVIVRGDSHLRGNRSLATRVAKYVPYRFLMQQIDAHMFVGQANYEYLRHYGVPERRLYFAPHFVENERFEAGASAARRSGEAASLRERWGASPDDVVYLFAGKLIEIKRVGDFVRAIAGASKRDARVRGVVVGSGPEADRLQALARAERAPVAFAGFRNQSAMPACYAAADCLVLPSSAESWGLVVNEAMASGIPAVVSDRVGSAPDLIQDGLTGCTYPVGDVVALTAAMLQMKEALTTRRADVHSAIRRRIGRYSCANAVAGTLNALEATADFGAHVPEQAGRLHA